MNSLLSQIEEKFEVSEGSGIGSDVSDNDSVSPINRSTDLHQQVDFKDPKQNLEKKAKMVKLCQPRSGLIKFSYSKHLAKAMKEVKYKSFDSYYNSNFGNVLPSRIDFDELRNRYESDTIIFVPRIDLSEVAEQYLRKLGNSLCELRKVESIESKLTTQSTKEVSEITLKPAKKRKLKKKLVKKRKTKAKKKPQRATSNWHELSTQLDIIAKKMETDSKFNKDTKKYSNDILKVPEDKNPKRARFNTWGNIETAETYFNQNTDKKEKSIRLEQDSGDYFKSFKSFAFKVQDEAKSPEIKIDSLDRNELKLSLNPCEPIQCEDTRKVSFNSFNNKAEKSSDEYASVCSMPHGLSQFHGKHKHKKKNTTNQLELANISKRKRMLTSDSDYNDSNIAQAAKKKKYKKSRKTSISDAEFQQFYVAFEQHAKSKKDSSIPTGSVKSTFSSARASPDIHSMKKASNKNSNNSLNMRENLVPNNLSPVKHLRKPGFAQTKDTSSHGSTNEIPLPTWHVAKIVNSLKDLEKDIGK